MKNLKLIKSILDQSKISDKNKKKKLTDFIWDSMTMINLISIIKEKYNKNVDVKKLRLLKNLEDLDAFLTKYTK